MGRVWRPDSRGDLKSLWDIPSVNYGTWRTPEPCCRVTAEAELKKLRVLGMWLGTLPGKWQRSGGSREENQSFRQHDLELCTGQEGTVPSVREWPPLMDGDSDTHPQRPGLAPWPTASNQPRWRRTNSTVCHCCWVPLPLAMSMSHCGPCPLSVNYLLAVPSPLAALSPRG